MRQPLRIKMDNDLLVEEFFEDSRLIGIVAPIKDYQFSWYLNQIMGLKFRMNNDIEIQLTKKQRTYFFSIYEYEIPSTSLRHYLYKNHFDGEYLLPEFKHLDFLWMIKGKGETIATEELNILMQSIRSLPGVQLVTEMTNEKIKNKQHLIF